MKKNIYTMYIKDIRKYSPVSRQRERELSERIISRHDPEALKELVTANLRLVIHLCFTIYDGRYRLDFLDLISEGNIAMIQAAMTWDCTRDVNGKGFASYASVIIKRRLFAHIYGDSRLVPVPYCAVKNKARVLKAAEILEQQYHRPPTQMELELLTGMNASAIQYIMRCDDPTIPIEEITEEEDRGGCTVTYAGCSDGAEELDESQRRVIAGSLADLLPMQRDILSSLFGIGRPDMSAEQIGAKYSLSGRRIRQLKDIGLAKLREKSEINAIHDELEPDEQ